MPASLVISHHQTESLVSVASLPIVDSLNEDLIQLQEHLEDNIPCYILARLDDPPSEWLAISYVPDFANVRDKVGPVVDAVELNLISTDIVCFNTEFFDQVVRLVYFHGHSICDPQSGPDPRSL
jgi:hypothetical protein